MNEKGKSIDDIMKESEISEFYSRIMGQGNGNVESDSASSGNNFTLLNLLQSLGLVQKVDKDINSSNQQENLLERLGLIERVDTSTYGGGTLGVVDSPMSMQMLMRNQEPVPQDSSGVNPQMTREQMEMILEAMSNMNRR